MSHAVPDKPWRLVKMVLNDPGGLSCEENSWLSQAAAGNWSLIVFRPEPDDLFGGMRPGELQMEMVPCYPAKQGVKPSLDSEAGWLAVAANSSATEPRRYVARARFCSCDRQTEARRRHAPSDMDQWFAGGQFPSGLVPDDSDLTCRFLKLFCDVPFEQSAFSEAVSKIGGSEADLIEGREQSNPIELFAMACMAASKAGDNDRLTRAAGFAERAARLGLAEAFLLLRLLDAWGEGQAAFYLGRLHEEWDSGKDALTRAAHWYVQAAQREHLEATARLKELSELEVDRDGHWDVLKAAHGSVEAMDRLTASMDISDDCQFHLATIYADGCEISLWPSTAAHLFERAARGGHLDARVRFKHLLAQRDEDALQAYKLGQVWQSGSVEDFHQLKADGLTLDEFKEFDGEENVGLSSAEVVNAVLSWISEERQVAEVIDAADRLRVLDEYDAHFRAMLPRDVDE